MVRLINEARGDDPHGSIAVLVRSRTHLDELMPALHAAGLRYQAAEHESLASRPVIDELRALTRLLPQPMPRLSWLALPPAPEVGLCASSRFVFGQDSRK